MGQNPQKKVDTKDVNQLLKGIEQYLFHGVSNVDFGTLPFDDQTLELLLNMKQTCEGKEKQLNKLKQSYFLLSNQLLLRKHKIHKEIDHF